MTPQQAQTVEWLRREILVTRNRYLDTPRYEYKQFDVKEMESSVEGYPSIVTVSAIVGSFGDEGTLNEIYGREHRHISVGPRGGVTLLNAKAGWNKVKGRAVLYAETRY